MKTLYKTLLLGMASLMCTPAMAQISAYGFAQSSSPYVPISGGVVVATATSNAAPGNLANTLWNLPNGSFPFPFVFNGNSYTGCNISSNGFITFGSTPPAVNLGAPISNNTAYDGAVSAWGRANNGVFNIGTSPLYTSELRMEVLGAAPNRTIVIQYDNWRYSSGTTTTAVWILDFQIRLMETTNVVSIVYGPGVMVGGSLSTIGFNSQVGLRGATNTDFNNRSNSSGASFSMSVPGTVNTDSQAWAVNGGVGVGTPGMPNSGLTYKWFPPCTGAPVTPTIAATATMVCEGDSLKFMAAGDTPFYDITYQWQQSGIPGGPYVNVPASGTTFATYQAGSTTGVYYFVLVSTCSNVPAGAMSNEIKVDVKPLPVIGILSTPGLNTNVSPIETCFGETYTLTATGANTYTWANGPVNAAHVVQPLVNTSYIVTGTSVDGCVSQRTLDILVNPLPVISTLTSPNNTLCPGNSIVVGASGNAVTYTWTAPSSNAFMITVSPTVTTTYSVVGTSVSGCTNMAVQQVVVHTVDPITPVSSVSSGTLCKGQKISLTATGATSYTWTTPNTYSTGLAVSATPEITTTYTITGTDANGCTTQTTLVQVVVACTGISEAQAGLNDLHIYPNPNNGIFTVELSNGAAKTLEVMDVTGKVVLSAATSEDRADLNISDLFNGVYFLRVQSNNAVQTLKVVKQ